MNAILFLLCFAFSYVNCSNPVEATVLQGRLRGFTQTTRLKRTIYSFLGIPYARPPVGPLRFQPPEEPTSWNGIRDATTNGFDCPQPLRDYTFPTSEDCLFLNVHTPSIPDYDFKSNYSVMVFFHPGAYYIFSGNSYYYGPQYLLDHDLVLVTVNYRIGALGFLSTGDEVLPGNYGLKDQVAALRWVQQNIAVFGGNPASVTIMGYSAGSRSVMLHMVSPMSKGLFHKAISMSGPGLSKGAIIRDQMPVAKRQAALFNCSTSTSQEIKDCLMNVDAKELAFSLRGLREWGAYPLLRFTPAIETERTKGDRFLTGEPIKLFLSGNNTDVPFLTGRNKDEFGYIAADILRNKTLVKQLNENFNKYAPILFGYERNTEESYNLSKGIKKFYFNNEPISNETLHQFEKVFIDSITTYGEDRSAKVISSVNKHPVYFYYFTYQGRYSFVYKTGTMEPYGVVHHDELIYLFYNSVRFPFIHSSDPESKMVEKLTKLWVNFVQYGNPTPEREQLFNYEIWQPLKPDNLNYLEIANEIELKKNLQQERMLFWESHIPVKNY